MLSHLLEFEMRLMCVDVKLLFYCKQKEILATEFLKVFCGTFYHQISFEWRDSFYLLNLYFYEEKPDHCCG